jgi:hypothetical protein
MRTLISTTTFRWRSGATAAAVTLCFTVLFLTAHDSIAAMITPPGQVTARQAYQDTRQRACNTAPTTCTLNFALIGANRRLEIRFVTCEATMAAGSQTASDATLNTSDDTNQIVLPLGAPWERTPAFTPGLMYNWSQPVQMFVPAGRRASVTIIASAALTMLCTISGEMLTLQ